jgi:hypothetical protein
MKKLLFAVLFCACGDNIVIPAPDAGTWQPPDEVGDLDLTADPTEETPVEAAPDAGAPDAPLPPCVDSHIELNGHEHKCTHDQVLPAK